MSRLRRLEPQDYLVKVPRSPFSTALRQIQVSLRLSRSAGQNQVFLFTSAQAGEGKTSFCISLARSLAMSGAMRVLVIDVDSRRSSLASRFGGGAIPNLGHLAETQVELADLVQKDTKSSTHFIAAAREDDCQRILYSERFADLITEARRTYDLIILDAPPILAGPDTALAGRFADATLFIVQWGRTSWEVMMSALRFLKLCCINVEGIIISHVAMRDTYYGRIPAAHLVSVASSSR
jgi:Mrp family chromosome partitioning ATPase